MGNKSRKTRKEKELAAERRRQRKLDTKTTNGLESGQRDANAKPEPPKDSGVASVSLPDSLQTHEYQAIRKRIRLSLVALGVIVAVQLAVWILARSGIIEIGNLLGGVEL